MGKIIELDNKEATISLGCELARDIDFKLLDQKCYCIFLNGDLGAGKTTFVKGFIRQFIPNTIVKSPTYTLVEPYEFDNYKIYHFDLYRLDDELELEYMGIRDYFTKGCICLIEWPSKANGVLPKPDLTIDFLYNDRGRQAILNYNK